MSADTLVLDHRGMPVAVMNWQDVMTLYAKERVSIIESDSKRLLRSAKMQMGMPVIVQLKTAFARKVRREVQFSKKNVAIRDRSMCQYCGRHLQPFEYTYDHVMPQSRGGKSSWKNLVLACTTCNSKKANKTPEEASMHLMQKPMKPSAQDERFSFRLRVHKLKSQWKPWSKWLAE